MILSSRSRTVGYVTPYSPAISLREPEHSRKFLRKATSSSSSSAIHSGTTWIPTATPPFQIILSIN